MAATVDVDLAILGGGIAGLWLLNRLQQRGYNCILLERKALGGEQSIASQGMIHGGIKYALGGALTGASEAIGDMPDHWRRCLQGQGDVDLRRASVLAEHFYLWSTAALGSRLTTFFASRMTRGRVEPVPPRDRPSIFANPAFHGQLYRLVDLVLDVPSVIAALADHHPRRIRRLDWPGSHFQRGPGGVDHLQLAAGDQRVTLRARRYVLAAGRGNGELLQALDAPRPAMQLRPLHQVLLRHDCPEPLYAHCMGRNPSPRLTISTHRSNDGRPVWYLGGDLATEGVALSPPQLIERARQELASLLPWVELGRTDWATLRIDRAEPRQQGLIRPDRAYASRVPGLDNVIATWPTKLTLAPSLASEVEDLLIAEGLQPSGSPLPPALAALPAPPLARPCWETLFD